MTPERFRDLVLELPQVEERSHQNHPDFRIGGKVFASLGPDGEWAMVKLTTELQARLVREQSEVFEAFNGAWGKQGCTRVHLRGARVGAVRDALSEAWKRTASKKLRRAFEAEEL